MEIDVSRPPKLYRYSEAQWLERSLRLGEFRLRPAADYKQLEGDHARQGDELVRVRSSPGEKVKITLASTGEEIKPIGEVTYRSEVGTNYLTVCFSERWDASMFSDFPNTDTCLVIHEVEEFCERFHIAVEAALSGWAGMDAKVTYGGHSPLGAVFSKPMRFIVQHEWRFAWRPLDALTEIQPLSVRMGSIERIAEIVRNQAHGVRPEQLS